jgi:hypothetical protein
MESHYSLVVDNILKIFTQKIVEKLNGSTKPANILT